MDNFISDFGGLVLMFAMFFIAIIGCGLSLFYVIGLMLGAS